MDPASSWRKSGFTTHDATMRLFQGVQLFSDPQSVTVNAVAQSMPRTGSSLTSGKFAKADGSYSLTTSQSTGRRNQHKVRLDSNKIIVDPFASERNLPVSMSIFLTVDVPPVGFSNVEQEQLVTALADWLKASTNANTIKLIGGEI